MKYIILQRISGASGQNQALQLEIPKQHSPLRAQPSPGGSVSSASDCCSPSQGLQPVGIAESSFSSQSQLKPPLVIKYEFS